MQIKRRSWISSKSSLDNNYIIIVYCDEREQFDVKKESEPRTAKKYHSGAIHPPEGTTYPRIILYPQKPFKLLKRYYWGLGIGVNYQ